MTLVAVDYVDDAGNTRVIAVDAGYQAQAALGLTASEDPTALPDKPDGSFKPRVALVVDATGTKRRIICGTATATAYTTPGTTVSFWKFRTAAGVSGKTYGHEGERLRYRPSAVTFA